MEKLDEDAVRGRLREVFPKLVVSGMDVCMGMSALWHLRKLGSRKFADVVQAETLLPVERAELLARSWEVARRSRELRELCLNRSWELIELVEGFERAGLSKHLEMVEDGDLAVVALLYLSPKQRLEVLRSVGEKRP